MTAEPHSGQGTVTFANHQQAGPDTILAEAIDQSSGNEPPPYWRFWL